MKYFSNKELEKKIQKGAGQVYAAGTGILISDSNVISIDNSYLTNQISTQITNKALFEVVDGSTSHVRLKSQYDYLLVNKGLFFEGSTLNNKPELEVRTNLTTNQRYLYSPLPLVTGGDQVIIGTASGGGGGGGGVSYLADLSDVKANMSPSVGDLLVWTSGIVLNTGQVGNGWANAPASGLFVDLISAQTITGIKTFANGLRIGSATLTWVENSGNGYLYLDTPLITAGDQIVQSGTPGGGGGSATYLADLHDVNINTSTLASGQALIYRNGEWVNESIGGGTITNVLLAPGDSNGTLHLVVNGIAGSDIGVTGLSASAYRDIANSIGASVDGLVSGSLLYSVLGDVFDSTNTVKAFVNSSIATATASFRGTNSTATTEAAFITWANSLTHDLNDYVFWATEDSTGNTVYKRYKYDGSQWLFEYSLNNSSFTAAQWDAISSGITSAKVTRYDTVAGYFGGTNNDILSVLHGGTGFASYTKGDLIYASTANVLSKLGANTSGTKQFLSMTSSVPSWTTLNSGDVGLGNVENVALSTWNGTNTITTVGTIGAGVWQGSAIDYAYLGATYIGLTRTQATAQAQSLDGIINHTMSGILTIGSARISYDAVNGCLYIDKPLVTSGDQIIESGTPGSGGSGAVYLSDLLDVSEIGKPQAQKILVFDISAIDKNGNTGAWVYSDLPSGSVTSISVNGQVYSPTSGIITLPNYPTSLPASDVYAWAKAVTKPSYTFSEIGSTPTTLNGYGITDANISNGVITLGSNSITPITSHQTVTLASGTNNGTLKITTASGTSDNIAVQGLGSLAYKNSLVASDIPDLSGSYLPLTGGTLSGALTVNANVSASGFHGALHGLWFSDVWSDANGNHLHNGLDLNSVGSSTGPVYLSGFAGMKFHTGWGLMELSQAGNFSLSSTAGDTQIDLKTNNNAYSASIKAAASFGAAFGLSYSVSGFQNQSLIVAGFNSSYQPVATIFSGRFGVLTVNGQIISTGDQVLNSDATLKKNLQDLKYTVEDIAEAPAVSFDWKDKEGHSFGSIAQYWKPICPEMVHGIEGQYSLAYAQGAFTNTIILAREIVKLRQRIKELESQLS